MRRMYRMRRVGVAVVLLAAIALSLGVLYAQTVTATSGIATMQGRDSAAQTPSATSSKPPSESSSTSSDQERKDDRSSQDDSSGGDAQDARDQDEPQTVAEPQAAIDWRAPSGGTQPDLSTMTDLSVEVSIADQKVYVRSGGNTVYTMVASTGMDGTTPTGDFTINSRGEHFYNPTEGMGADYWVAFLSTTYLFHSVPTYADMGDYIESEALKLGQPASHGCVRLTVADAQWLYDGLPDGTPVHIA